MDDAQCRIGRAALGLTEDELAEMAGVTPADIRALERGGNAALPPESLIAKHVAEAFLRAGVSFRADARGRPVMRIQTLDGIIEAPVEMRSPR